MKVFLDSSVLLAAAGSTSGASRLIIQRARRAGWILLTADYCLREAEHNLHKLGPTGLRDWPRLIRPKLKILVAKYVLNRPLLYRATKDRPVIISALSIQADVLLTLDRDDFHDLLGKSVYGLPLRTPGEFLREYNDG